MDMSCTYALPNGPLRLPLKCFPGAGGLGTTALRVVDGHVLVNDPNTLGERVALLLLNLLDNVLSSAINSITDSP
jgi:hypothetical protein